tara:strand:- start:1947 stop:3968 length:2022 start_codon:yes stop_codon:yes gene_type:complete
MNNFRGEITPTFAAGNPGKPPMTDEQERIQRLLEALIVKTPSGLVESTGETLETVGDVVGSIGQLDKAEQLGRQYNIRKLPDIVSALTEQPKEIATALGQGLEQEILDKGLGAIFGVEDVVAPGLGTASKLMTGIGAAAMMGKVPKMSKAAQDVVDASKRADVRELLTENTLSQIAKDSESFDHFFHKTAGGKYDLDVVERLQNEAEGETGLLLGDFIIGKKVRELYSDALNTPIIILNTPVSKGKKVDLGDGEFFGAAGSYKGLPAIFLSNDTADKRNQIIGTILEEGAHVLRKQKGREVQGIKQALKGDLDAYAALPEELSAKKMVEFAAQLEEDKDGLLELFNKAITDDARVRDTQRASFGTPAYHGTTHDIQEFTLERSNPENYLGQAHYFTSSPIDASENYGGQGPDLTNRIEFETEKLDHLTDNELKEMVSKEAADKFDSDMKRVDESEQNKLRNELLREAAKEKLTTHEGAVMDVQLQLKNPLYIDGSDKEQRFKLDVVYDDDGDIVEEKGNLIDLHKAIVEAGYEFDGGNGDELAGAFMEQASDYFGDKMYDEGLTATDVNYILQNMEKSDLYTDDGSFAGNEFIRQVYENLGHDSVVMDASKAFKMENVPEGTKHYIVFDKHANQIRSRRAKFDPKKSDSRNILASTLPIGLGAGAAAYTTNEE